MTIASFSFPTAIRFGDGVCGQLPDLIASHGLQRPLLVTDRHIAELPFFKELRQRAAKGGAIVGVFDGLLGNPIASQVVAGVQAYHDHGADSLVLIGGGATLDVGKAIALMVNHPGHLFDYEDGKPDGRPVDQPVPFMIAIPTTAGTGSEVGRASVISDDVSKQKRIIFAPQLLPNVVLADPALTLDLPPTITAATGFDALTHNIEAYLALGYHPICDGIAREGVRLIAGALARAVQDGSDIEARRSMLMASMMGAVAFQKGLGITHSCAHALSTVHDTHHGLANAVMLPAALEFNSEVSAARLEDLGVAVGLSGANPAQFIDWVVQLRRDCGLEQSLRALGITEISDELVDCAFADPVHALNPRAATRQDFLSLYEQAL